MSVTKEEEAAYIPMTKEAHGKFIKGLMENSFIRPYKGKK